MKQFSTKSEGNPKPAARGKGFPRHYYKHIALSEDEAVEGFSGETTSTRIGMNKSYGRLSPWSHSSAWLKSSHISRWLHAHLGQSVDKVFSEFRENLPHGVDWGKRPSELFAKYILHGDAGYPSWYEFMVDDQGRLQKNPEYRKWTSYNKPKYAPMCVKENQRVLDELREEIRHTNSFTLVGPVKIKKQLWVKHPVTGEVKKMKVYLTRVDIFEKEPPKYWYEIPLNEHGRKLSDKTIEYIQDTYCPVNVIETLTSAPNVLQVQDTLQQTMFNRYRFYSFAYVVARADL